MIDTLQAMSGALDAQQPLAALFIALALPDMCGKHFCPEGTGVGKRYVAWTDEFLAPLYRIPKPRSAADLARLTILRQGVADALPEAAAQAIETFREYENHLHHFGLQDDAEYQRLIAEDRLALLQESNDVLFEAMDRKWKYIALNAPMDRLYQLFDGLDLYRVRNAVLHAGDLELDPRRKSARKTPFSPERIQFTLPRYRSDGSRKRGSHYNWMGTGRVLQLDLGRFCDSVNVAVQTWLEKSGKRPHFEEVALTNPIVDRTSSNPLTHASVSATGCTFGLETSSASATPSEAD